MPAAKPIGLRSGFRVGVAPTALVGKTDEEILDRADGARLGTAKREVMEAGVAHRDRVEVELDGRCKIYALSLAPEKNRAGDIVGVTTRGTDPTEDEAG